MLLRDATLATLQPAAVERADLRIEAGRIVARARELASRAGEETVDLAGALVLPGFVNAHTHLYSALARGMPPPAEPPRSFVEILEKVWWRLDRALDEEAVRLSALVGAIDAARSGTTLLVDHHASPSFVRGSLDTVRRAVEEVGLRSVLCYETTDRNGVEGRDAGLAESAAFLAGGPAALTRARVGAHASFTLADESLGRLAAVARGAGSAIHVHVAEDRADVDDAVRRGAAGVVDRLRRHGLLVRDALLVHAVHLDEREASRESRTPEPGSSTARANMNNAVGRARVELFDHAALGTDGMDEDLLAEARAAFLWMRDAGRPDAFAAAIRLVAGSHRLASALFGEAFRSGSSPVLGRPSSSSTTGRRRR
ncbi:MAG: amidohydrolase family protein [Vicinamibacteria bacterium]